MRVCLTYVYVCRTTSIYIRTHIRKKEERKRFRHLPANLFFSNTSDIIYIPILIPLCPFTFVHVT